MNVNIPVQTGNVAAQQGRLGQTIQVILKNLKPEAAYFTADHGKRTAYLVLNLKDVPQIPSVAEPWLLAFHAAIEISPAMAPEDLTKAGAAIETAVKKYGGTD